MKNVITFDTNGFLSLENIESGADSVIIRYYVRGLTAPMIKVEGTAHSLTISGDYGEYILDLTDITRADSIRHFCLTDSGADYDTSMIVFYDFDADGDFHANLWQKRLQVYQTENTAVYHAYIIALVETDTTTIGDGLTVTDRAELKVNAGAGLTTTEDGKVAAIQALKNVDTIDVTESGDLISSITINYNDETSNTYACSYDTNDNLISFGGVTINWE